MCIRDRNENNRQPACPEREAGKGVRRRGQTACCLPSRHSLNGACFCAVKSCSCCARSTRAGGCSREKRHADGFGTFNFATLVFLLLARHSPQAVSARAACVGCHQKYRESRDDVAGVLYLFSAKSTDRSLRLVLFAAFWSAVNRGLRPRGTLYFLVSKVCLLYTSDAADEL